MFADEDDEDKSLPFLNAEPFRPKAASGPQESNDMLELKAKAWIARDGELVFGKGRAQLLEAVDATGSLSAAARRLEMSYRRAWSMIGASEERLGFALLHRSKGGANGGGARLTQAARDLLDAFRRIESRIKSQVRKEEDELQGVLGANRRA